MRQELFAIVLYINVITLFLIDVVEVAIRGFFYEVEGDVIFKNAGIIIKKGKYKYIIPNRIDNVIG